MNLREEGQIVINVEHDGLSVDDYLKSLLWRWTVELAHTQCRQCREGSVAIRRSRQSKAYYMHRMPTGKKMALNWYLCRASELWLHAEENSVSREIDDPGAAYRERK